MDIETPLCSFKLATVVKKKKNTQKTTHTHTHTCVKVKKKKRGVREDGSEEAGRS